MRLGQIVTSALYRNPGPVGADGGHGRRCLWRRVIIGVGAGWDEREYREFGYGELPPVRERLAHLEETLRVLKRRTRLPILVGGAGEKVLLRLVAEHADACNFTDSFDPAFYRHKLEVLRGHCDAVGRDFGAIEKTASFTVRGEVDFGALAATGIETFIVYLDPPTDLANLERFARRLIPN